MVGFIVRSVDEVLRDQFGLEDGLASTATWGELIAAKPEITLPDGAKASDPFVRILDPATGTGTFLVETIDLIWNRMRDKWRKAGNRDAEIATLWNDYVPDHLLPRLYGFELMMAPYAIAHMKLGLKLHETGYRFGSDERARIYLTNALEPAQDFDMQLAFMSEALAHEAQAANAAKEMRFTVVVGNPPYAGHSKNNNVPWIVDKVHDYKRDFPDLQKPGQGKWLQDDYVKFVRLSQEFLETSKVGVIGVITNHAWLDNPTFKGMRSSLLASASALDIFDFHGNYKKKEKAPDGGKDENVFSEVGQGVAVTIVLFGTDLSTIRRSELYGLEATKLSWLSQNSRRDVPWQAIQPFPPENILQSLDAELLTDFRSYPSLPEIMDRNGDPAPGMVTTHDEFAISWSPDEQLSKVDLLLSTKSEVEAREHFRLCSQAQWNWARAKKALASNDWHSKVTSVLYRPFDVRYTVYDPNVTVHRRERVTRHLLQPGNVALVSVRQVAEEGFNHALVTQVPTESRITISNRGIGFVTPLWLMPSGSETRTLPNLNPSVIARIESLVGCQYDDGVDPPKQAQLSSITPERPEHFGVFSQRRGRGSPSATFGPRDVFDWIYAVLHSPAYRSRYADYLKSDFARIPLPGSRELFQGLVPLGTELVALHLLDATIATALKDPQAVRFAGHGEARVEQAGVWTPPSGGRVTISDHRWFEGVPERVWNFQIGGYQPAQKWLKDRAKKGGKKSSPGRVLTAEDQLHYRQMIAAMDRTIDLMAEIDGVIDQHGGWPGAFRGIADE